MTVSISIATTRSISVLPITRRITPNRIAANISTAAIRSMISAKDFLQMLFERRDESFGGSVDIGRLHVEPVNEQDVVANIHHQRTGRELNRIGQREPAERRLQTGAHLDDAGLDVDARR